MTVRGENVTICATVDLDREDSPRGLKFVPEEEVRALAASQKAAKKTIDDRKAKALKNSGIEPGFGMQAWINTVPGKPHDTEAQMAYRE
jgi:U6 snRNA-associated Sm-like protein LSm1